VIQAAQQDYKRAFQRHLHAYSNWDKTGSDISKRLILVYCVECGLKYAVMQKIHIQNMKDAQPDLEDELRSHDLQKLMKRLKIAGNYFFPQIRTVHGDTITVATYHQFCRYSIPPFKGEEIHIKTYDDQLENIANWLKERVF